MSILDSKHTLFLAMAHKQPNTLNGFDICPPKWEMLCIMKIWALHTSIKCTGVKCAIGHVIEKILALGWNAKKAWTTNYSLGFVERHIRMIHGRTDSINMPATDVRISDFAEVIETTANIRSWIPYGLVQIHVQLQ